MKDNTYHVTIWRRGIVSNLQMNFYRKNAAEAAFKRLCELKARGLFEDDYGIQIMVDPTDIAHVVFVDQVRSTEMQIDAQVVMQNTAASLGLKHQQEAATSNFNGTVPMVVVGPPENQKPN